MHTRRPFFLGTLALALLAGTVTPAGWALAKPDAAWSEDPVTAIVKQPSAPAAANAASLKTERAVVFKDGHALIIKHVTGMTDADGRLITHDVPDSAVLGCFWAISDQGSTVGMRAEWITESSETKRTDQVASLTELLKVNLNKPVRITSLLQRPAPVIEGTVQQVLEAAPGHVILSNVQGAESADKQLFLPISDIHSITTDKLTTTIERTDKAETRTKRLTFDLGRANANRAASLRLFYFTPGLRWIPTYRITGLNSAEGELALQGEIINELEDLNEAELDLVAGVPNFRFKDVVSPLSLEQAIRQSLQHAGSRGREMMTQQFSNAVFDQRSPEEPAFVAPREVEGSGEQDLYVYSVGRVSLARSARATLPLWRQNAPIRHVYTFYVKPEHERPKQSYGSSNNTDYTLAVRPEDDTRIWHQLELSNVSTGPWTSGPALAMQDFVPVSQDLLPYTSPSGKALLPLTVAVDMRGEYDEEELSRQPVAVRVDGYDYFKVKKRGTITLRSYRDKPSDTCVNVRLIGSATTADPQAILKIDALRRGENDPLAHTRINNVTQARWDVTLAPGETKKLTIEYEVYMR